MVEASTAGWGSSLVKLKIPRYKIDDVTIQKDMYDTIASEMLGHSTNLDKGQKTFLVLQLGVHGFSIVDKSRLKSLWTQGKIAGLMVMSEIGPIVVLATQGESPEGYYVYTPAKAPVKTRAVSYVDLPVQVLELLPQSSSEIVPLNK